MDLKLSKKSSKKPHIYRAVGVYKPNKNAVQHLALVGMYDSLLLKYDTTHDTSYFRAHSTQTRRQVSRSTGTAFTVGSPHPSNIKKPQLSFFVFGYIAVLQRLTNRLSRVGAGTTTNLTSFLVYIVKKRSYMRFNMFKTFRNLEDRYLDNTGLTEEERERLGKAFDIIDDVLKLENWNKNTEYFKQTEKL